MILVSVGTQFPFDRLVRAVDEWAAETGRTDVIAQTGPTEYNPKAIKCFNFINPEKFRELQAAADIMIAHAGMGSILTASEFGKPLVIMARDHKRGEHRNGHQFATAARFRNTPGLYFVEDEKELRDRLSNLNELVAGGEASGRAPQDFLFRLRSFIEEAPRESVWTRLFRRSE